MGGVVVDVHQSHSARHRPGDVFCMVILYIALSLLDGVNAFIVYSLVVFIIPPSGVVFIFFLGTLTLLIGIGLAWAWGVIVMKAALAARPQAETQAKLQSLQQAIANQVQATGENAGTVQQKFIYDGFMLDARVSAIYFVLICLFIYLLVCLFSRWLGVYD